MGASLCLCRRLAEWLPLWRSTGSRACGLQRRRRLGPEAEAQEPRCSGSAARGMWGLPGPGAQPCLLRWWADSIPEPPGQPPHHAVLTSVSSWQVLNSKVGLFQLSPLQDGWLFSVPCHQYRTNFRICCRFLQRSQLYSDGDCIESVDQPGGLSC